MEAPKVLLQEAPWHRTGPWHVDCEYEKERGNSEKATARPCSPGLPFKVVAYAVKNTFIDVGVDSEPNTPVGSSRARAVTDGVPWHHTRLSREEGEYEEEWDSMEQTIASPRASSPALPETPLAYVVRNTFIDSFTGVDADSESDICVGCSRARAATDGVFEYVSLRKRSDGGEVDQPMCASKSLCKCVPKASFQSPTSGDADQHRPTSCADEGTLVLEVVQTSEGTSVANYPVASRATMSPLCSMLRGVSSGSISTMADSVMLEELEVLNTDTMSYNWSSNSLVSLASEYGAAPSLSPEEPIEFDLTIEEDPVEDCLRNRSVAESSPLFPKFPKRISLERSLMGMVPSKSSQSPVSRSSLPVRSGSRGSSPAVSGSVEVSYREQLTDTVGGSYSLVTRRSSLNSACPCNAFSSPERAHLEVSHNQVPRTKDMKDEYDSCKEEPPTTMMIRNLPCRYTQNDLMSDLAQQGFAGTYNFLYIPVDKRTAANVGYAFVNFISPVWAAKCQEIFEGFRFLLKKGSSTKLGKVSIAFLQGLEKNLEHYENSVVNTSGDKRRRPVVFPNLPQA